MKYNNRSKAVLLLKDGTIFHGKSIGIEGVTFGEVAFNTGTTGYQKFSQTLLILGKLWLLPMLILEIMV